MYYLVITDEELDFLSNDILETPHIKDWTDNTEPGIQVLLKVSELYRTMCLKKAQNREIERLKKREEFLLKNIKNLLKENKHLRGDA